MFLLLKISCKQLFSKTVKKYNKFIICFSIFSLFICLSALIIVSSLSQGFKNEINHKLSAIDGHFRINDFHNTHITFQSEDFIKNTLSLDTNFLSFSSYTENYAMINVNGKTEGVLVYGVEEDKILDLFNITFNEVDDPNLNSIIIGKKLANIYNINIGDELILFNIKDLSESNVYAMKSKISNIFDSGFSEYDKSVCFIKLSDSCNLFNYSYPGDGIIGKVINPIIINDQFNIIFKNIDLDKFKVTTWIDRHAGISQWLQTYSRPIVIVIASIILLVLLNMSLSLWILALDRFEEISVLIALGFTRIMIGSMIVFQNIILTSISIFLAVLFSFSLLFLQYAYHFITVSREVYFVSYIPVGFNYFDIISYCLFFFLLSCIISFFPAYKIYSIKPIQYIKND